MPDLVGFTRGFRHTLDSALDALEQIGAMDQVFLENAGPGSPAGTIVRQRPAPGAELAGREQIHLWVAGSGGLLRLPPAMRALTRAGSTAAMGEAAPRSFAIPKLQVDRLLALFDDQVLRLSHHIRRAGGYLVRSPRRTAGTRRWVEEIFGLPANIWTAEQLYRLAKFLPSLHRRAGRLEGLRAGFASVLSLDLHQLALTQRLAPLPVDEWTRLGAAASRLGIDAVVGQGVPVEAGVVAIFHVPDVAAYRAQATEEAARRRAALYTLLLPSHLHFSAVREQWKVGARLGARLGGPRSPATLGQDCYLAPVAAEAHT